MSSAGDGPKRHFAWGRGPDQPPEAWGPPTLLHALAEEPGIRDHPQVELVDRGSADHAIPDPGPGAPPDYYAKVRARCPGCRRNANWTWTLVDVRVLPDAVTSGVDFACDGCWRGWIRRGRMAFAEWLALHGAPEENVRRAARDDERFGREPQVPEHAELPDDVAQRLRDAAAAKRRGLLTARDGLSEDEGGGG